MKILSSTTFAILVLFSSSGIGGGESAQSPAAANVCEEPRPEVCTMDYRPACGTLADGSVKTYSNGCGACGDAKVVSWVEGECPK